MFYCGIINVGNGPILQIIGGSGDPMWIAWKDNNCIKTTRISCSLLEKSIAFLKVFIYDALFNCIYNKSSKSTISQKYHVII